MNLPDHLRRALLLLLLPIAATAQSDHPFSPLPADDGRIEFVGATDRSDRRLRPEVVVGADGRVGIRLAEPGTAPRSAAGSISEEWDERFGGELAIGSGSVNTIAVDGSRVYVGGSFTGIGGIRANNIAFYDRTTGRWSQLGSATSNGVSGSSSFVTDIEVQGSDLYVGGFFSDAGGTIARNIARWDGARWHPVGSGMGSRGYVSALTMHEGKLIAGGNFSIALSSGDTINALALWNGTRWSTLGSGFVGGPYHGHIMSLLSHDTMLYAGGIVVRADDSTFGGLLRWDGMRWRSIGDTLGRTPIITAMATAPNGDLYAGGAFDHEFGFNGIARWDGARWHRLGEGLRRPFGVSSPIAAIAIAPDGTVYAGGDLVDSAGSVAVNSIARWDGEAWHAMGRGLYYGVDALAIVDGGVLAGGRFTRAGSVDAHGLALWDGAAWGKWAGEISQAGGDIYCSAVDSQGRLYVAGSFGTAGGVPANNIARWDGTGWSALGTGVGGTVNSIAITPGGEVYIGGGYGYIGRAGESATFNMARWDGVQWHPVGDSSNGTQIFAMAYTPAGLVSGGGSLVDTARHGIGLWDGSRWQTLGDGLQWGSAGNGLLYALHLRGGDLYAGGMFDRSGGRPMHNIARWDGTGWSALGDGIPASTGGGSVHALTSIGDDLFIGGTFRQVNGIASSGVVRWNIPSSTWSSPAGGVSSGVYALSSIGGDLFAGGSFDHAGGEPIGFIARWDGSSWHPLGSGVNSTVWTLATTGRALYVGGAFDMAGGRYSPGFASWRGAVGSAPASDGGSRLAMEIRPNPASGEGTMLLEIPVAGRVTIDLLSTLGEPVATIFDGFSEAGAQMFRWNSDGLATGTYLVRARAGARQETEIVAVVR